MHLVGIDPGRSGAIAIQFASDVECHRMPETDGASWELLASLEPACVAIEKAQAGPKMASSAAFKYGKSYGILIGQLRAAGLRIYELRPAVWQKEFGLVRSRASANRFASREEIYRQKKQEQKQLASKLYPELRVFHWNADALLLLEWMRRTFHGDQSNGKGN